MSPRAQHRAMGWLRACALVAGGIGLTCACGSAPEPPAPIDGAPGAGSAPSTDQDILPNRPVSGDTTPDRSQPDAGSGQAGEDTEPPPNPPVAEAGAPIQAPDYYACTDSRLVGCDYIHVTARDFEADLCLQLTLDNCGEAGERTLAVDTPLGWRLASGSALAGTGDCVAGEFYLKSAPATGASGDVSWDIEARPPADLVVAVTLVLSPSPEMPSLPTRVTLSGELVGPLPSCAD